ncbi:MAG: MtrB/PioB family outer membrane beta-barrel protein, partial [Bacteroidales bacterium]
MRNRLMMSTAALLLASASLAFGQAKQQPQQPQQQQQEQPALAGDTTGGVVDVAGRFTSTDGDSARYERYRDLRSGVNANLLYSKVTADYIFNVTAQNVGYRDQRYTMAFNSKKFKGSFFFNQIPLNYGFADDNITRTPYQCSAGSCTLDVSARTGVENKALIGIPANVSQLGNPSKSVYDGLARAIDLKSLRSTIGGNLIYSATDNLDLTFDFNTFSRTGNMPWGASFAFPVGIELPLEIDNRTTNVTAGIEWASHQGMMRVSYDYSKFNQNIPYLDWDNPQRATDFCKT